MSNLEYDSIVEKSSNDLAVFGKVIYSNQVIELCVIIG